MSSETPMRRREHDDRISPPQSGGDDGGDHLEAIRGAAQGLLAAGDRAIEQALSRDSAAYLWANRQRGGQ